MHFFACLLRQELFKKCTTFFDTYFSVDRFSASNCKRRSMLPLDIPAARCCSYLRQGGGAAVLPNADNRNKGVTVFRRPQECSSGLDCGISYAAMLLISCTMRSCSVSSSSNLNTCIKTFSVRPSAFASLAGDTFLNLSSENTISLAIAISPFHVSKHFLWNKMFLSLSSISIIAKA